MKTNRNEQQAHVIRHSGHSELRKKQRGIPDEAVDCALEYGYLFHAGHGDSVYWLCRKAVEDAGPKAGRYVDIAVIMTPDGRVRTVMHRSQPAHHWKRVA